MDLRRLARGAGEAWEVPRDLLLRRYPPFVTGGALGRGEIPVFVFHDADESDFARKLDHLAGNGYVTLSTHEYVDVIRGRREPPPRAVLLTFDDGRASVAGVAAPLLQRRGMKATVFLVPGRMRASPGDDAGALGLMSWQDVETLAATGLFDFQSHTLRHARMHVEPRLAGFANPQQQRGYAAFDQPLVRDGEHDLLGGQVPLGTPLLRSAPRTSERPRFLEDPGVRARCVSHVAENGGAAFFEAPDWSRRLRRVFGGTPLAGRLETREEQLAALRTELASSRSEIERHTGRPVRHLCYPWHAAGPTARRLAAEAGYETAFAGKVAGVPVTLAGGDLANVARIGEDYVELLPGRGRATLPEILRRKWLRRFGAVRVR